MDRSVIKEVWVMDIYNQHGIKVEEGDTVIDIRAHIGIFSTYASKLNKTGEIFAFEPFIENYKILEKHKLLNHCDNITVYNKAIAGSKGHKTLFLSPDNNTGGHSFHLKTQSDNKIDVNTITLTEFCDNNKIKTIDFLKLDCEGAEFEIIQSDDSILNRVKKIIMECHPYQDNTVSSMVSLLENKGFNVIRNQNLSDKETQMLYAKKNKN